MKPQFHKTLTNNKTLNVKKKQWKKSAFGN